jgi:hypothetical protein
MRERRAPRLYINCDEKFAPGHKCKMLFLIDRCYEEESVDEEQLAAIEEEIPEISLHAMGGTLKQCASKELFKAKRWLC